MSGIGVVLNPHSKRYRRLPQRLDQMAFIVGEQGHFRATQSLADLESVARQFRDKQIDVLALSGGDGTNHKTLTTFIKVYGDQPLPKIAFLLGGTLNTVAVSCGIRGTPEKLLMKLIYQYHEGEPFKTKAIRPACINGSYGFIWGCGVIFRFMDAYYSHGQPSPLHAAWTLTRTIASALVNGRFASELFRRFDAEVTVDGKRWPYANYNAIYAGAIKRLGLGFKVFYLIEEQNPFHIVAFSLPPRNVLRYVPKMFMGKPSGCPDLLEEGSREVKITLKEPQAYMIDGDMYGPTDSFLITPGPELQIITL